MAQADTNFPKVRRMLFYVSPLIFGYFWPASTLLRGHHRSCLFLRPILKFLGIGVALMRITWANYSKRWFLVSNVGVTQHGFGELNTSDWLQYVSALPTKSMKTSAAPYLDIRNPIVVYSSIKPLQFCHHSFETFC